MMVPISGALGALIGWVFTGRHLEGGGGRSVAVGLGSAALLTFWVMFLFAFLEMIHRTGRMAYGGSPTAAVQDVFAIMMDFGRNMLQTDVIGILVVGGLLVGVFTGWVGKRFR